MHKITVCGTETYMRKQKNEKSRDGQRGRKIPANLVDYTNTHEAGLSKQKLAGSHTGHTNAGTRRCKHMARLPCHHMFLPGAAEGHQPVFVVDSHAGTVGHICRPDTLQLLRPHKKRSLLSKCGYDIRGRPAVDYTTQFPLNSDICL